MEDFDRPIAGHHLDFVASNAGKHTNSPKTAFTLAGDEVGLAGQQTRKGSEMSEARLVQRRASDPHVKALAEIVSKLAGRVAKLEAAIKLGKGKPPEAK
jgi:hypothetical protein